MNGRNAPDDLRVHVAVIVGHNVAHNTHLAKRKLREGVPGFFGQMGNGFSNDFDPPDNSILFLHVGAECGFRGALDIGGNETRGFQNVVKPAQLFSLHRHRRPKREYARGRTDSAIVPKNDVGRNPPVYQPAPPPFPPFPEVRQSKPVRPMSPASPYHCLAWSDHVRPNRKPQDGGCDAFHRKASGVGAN